MTKADKIRRYLAKGMKPSEIVKKLDCYASEVYRVKSLMRREKANLIKEPRGVPQRNVFRATRRGPVAVQEPSKVNDIQVGGDHYKKYGDLQPWDIWTLWNLNPFQAAILKYVVRYRDKEGVKDLEKARHFLDKLIEVEGKK